MAQSDWIHPAVARRLLPHQASMTDSLRTNFGALVMPTLLDDYLTRDELAKELKVSWRTIIRWCERGDGPPVVKVGRRPMFKRSSVAAWLDKREGRAA
jgi:excisionase family DNA binding protein